MDDEQRPFIFEKREVALIFICMILIAFLSFSMGVKVGKNYTFKEEGFIKEDKKALKLKSNLEEEIEAKVYIESEKDLEETKENISNFNKLEDEFKKVKEEVIAEEAPAKVVAKEIVQDKIEKKPRSKFSGKFTIELGTYRTFTDSEKFADGFRIRGYDPIIEESDTFDHGIMYRVSLGVFSTKKEAQEYVLNESSLFAGQEFIISQFE